MPVIRLNSVVLPAPFGPITETISPSFTRRSRPSTTFRPPKESETLLSSRMLGRSPLDNLDPALTEQAVGTQDHQSDQDQPEHDVTGRLGLREHHVLPD